MKRYFRDLDTDTKTNIIMNNEDLREKVSEIYYEELMEQQYEEGNLMFGDKHNEYIDIRNNYNSFYLRLKNWYKFIENLDKDYLCDKGIDLYNEIIELKKEYENCDCVEEEEKFDNLEEELEDKCNELLEICENQLHEYENMEEEDLKDWLQFELEENNLYEDLYIIDNDLSIVYRDITRKFR